MAIPFPVVVFSSLAVDVKDFYQFIDYPSIFSPPKKLMLYKIARFLQLLGLLICPVGIAGNVLRPEQVSVKATLIIAAGGILIFTVGWLLQQTTKPR